MEETTKKITLETMKETMEQTRESIKASIPKMETVLSNYEKTGIGDESTKRNLTDVLLCGKALHEICEKIEAGEEITEALYRTAVALSEKAKFLTEEELAFMERAIRHPNGKLN